MTTNEDQPAPIGTTLTTPSEEPPLRLGDQIVYTLKHGPNQGQHRAGIVSAENPLMATVFVIPLDGLGNGSTFCVELTDEDLP